MYHQPVLSNPLSQNTYLILPFGQFGHFPHSTLFERLRYYRQNLFAKEDNFARVASRMYVSRVSFGYAKLTD
jgi:hypothetical protein